MTSVSRRRDESVPRGGTRVPKAHRAKPARNPITRRMPSVRGSFVSAKNGCAVSWESQLERDLLYLLEVDPRVLLFREQPVRLHLFVDGRRREHVPDLLVDWVDCSAFIEVKPEDKVFDPNFQAVALAAAADAERRGLGYRVASEGYIRREPRLSNAKLLYRYLTASVPDIVRADVVWRLSLEPVTLGRLVASLAAYGGLAPALGMVGRCELSVDLNAPITVDSLVSTPNKEALR